MLCQVLGPSAQERHKHIGQSPAKGLLLLRETLEYLSYEERLRQKNTQGHLIMYKYMKGCARSTQGRLCQWGTQYDMVTRGAQAIGAI